MGLLDFSIPQWKSDDPGIDPGMSFLSQIPQALLGRPTTGVVDFTRGAIEGLGTGDAGGASPGILGSLGRIGMMALAVRQSKDPTAILRVKDYFDRQDAMKRDALSQPDAGSLTGEQFQGKYGFVPPVQNRPMNPETMRPASGSDVMGGRAQVMPMTIANPADMDKMLRFQQQQGRVNASNVAGGPNSYEGRQILENGFGPQERTQQAGANVDAYLADHPIDEKRNYIGYKTGPNGEVLKTIETRNEELLNYDDLVEGQKYLDESGLRGKIAYVPDLVGHTSDGKPLFKASPFSLPKEGKGSSGSPINDYFRTLVSQGVSIEEAAAQAGKLGDLLAGDSRGGKSKDNVIGWFEDQYGVKFTAEEKLGLIGATKAINAAQKESPLDAEMRKMKNLPDPATQAQMTIQEIVKSAVGRKAKDNGDSGDPRDSRDYTQEVVSSKARTKGTTNPEDFSQYAPYAGRPVGTDGGSTEVLINKPGKYDTPLPKEKEAEFVIWKGQNAPRDSGEDYDWRGAFLAGAQPSENGHWPDKFKKPNHPTFSNESQYAVGEDAKKAGKWEGENYIKPQAQEVKKEGPKPSPTPGGQMASPSRKEIPSPKPQTTPAPQLKLKKVGNIETDTAKALDSKIKNNGYAPGMIQEYAGMLKNSDLNEAEQVKLLEGIIQHSKNMTPEQKKQAKKAVSSMILGRR